MRVTDWPERLNNHLLATGVKPFEWGVWDCAIFCSSMVQELTGRDYFEEFRGKYKSEQEARVLFEPYGGYVGLLREVLGDPIDVRMARRGDLAVYIQEGKELLGVVTGERVAFILENRPGFTTFPLTKCKMAWKID